MTSKCAILLLLAASRSVAGPSPVLPSGIGLCEGKLFYSGVFNLKDPRNQLFNDVLELKSKVAVIEFLAGHPLLKHLNLAMAFDTSAGVREGFTLREHTQMVYSVYRDQEIYYDLARGRLYGLDLPKILEFVIALHDIGKPFAVIEFEKKLGHAPREMADFKEISRRQLQFTLPIVDEVMAVFSFKPDEARLVRSLLNNDIIGQVITKRISPQDGFRELDAIAQDSSLSLPDYLMMKTLLYVSDAAAYPGLRYGRGLGSPPQAPVFIEQEDGKLMPIATEFYLLTDFVDSADLT